MKEYSILLCHLGCLQNQKTEQKYVFRARFFFLFVCFLFFIFNKENPEINSSRLR